MLAAIGHSCTPPATLVALRPLPHCPFSLCIHLIYPYYLVTGKKQANSLVNEEDKAFQSRYLLLQFGALVQDEVNQDPNLYNQCACLF